MYSGAAWLPGWWRSRFEGYLESSPEIIMKIQKLTIENRPMVYALLQRAFPGSDYEASLVRKLHENGRPVHEWVCIHTGKVIAYIAFSQAYRGSEVCGLHLAPMAVAPDFQRQGVGTELLRFALRQEAIKGRTLFVLGEPVYYKSSASSRAVSPSARSTKTTRISWACGTVSPPASWWGMSPSSRPPRNLPLRRGRRAGDGEFAGA
jgi:predicted N-acetyltransferase YhbS